MQNNNNNNIPTPQNVDATITVEQVNNIDMLFAQMHEMNTNFRLIIARMESIDRTNKDTATNFREILERLKIIETCNSDTARMVKDVKCELLQKSDDFYSLHAWFLGLGIDYTQIDYETKFAKLEQISVDLGVLSKMVAGQECFHISVFEGAFTTVPLNF